MRLQVNDYGFDSQLPNNEEESVIENSEKMFSILSDAIYKDKPLAVIRELSCNARDAMYDAGKGHLPFRIKLPTYLEPSFRVEDDGVGIHPSEMRKIYLTYGRSTKTEDDNAIGALGLGSKSPFAYTKSSFIVKNRWHSAPSTDPEALPITEYTYFIFINKNGKPAISFVGSQPTDLDRGITVEFAVKTEDINTFIQRADRFFRYWKEVLPEFVDYEHADVLTTKIIKVIDGGSWYLEERDKYSDYKGAVATMGNVPYPILYDSIPNLSDDLKIIAKNSFVIDFPLGHLAFAPSREDLSYDEFTCKNIEARLRKIRDEMADRFKEQILAPGQTQLQFRQNFYQSLTKFGKVIRTETRNYTGEDDNAWICKFIFGTTINGSILYDGFYYLIEELFSRYVKQNIPRYQPFKIITKDVRGRNARVYLKSCTGIKATVTGDIDHSTIFNATTIGRKILLGASYNFDWASKVFSHRKNIEEYNPLQRAFISSKFVFETNHKISIESENVTFIINDDGGAGEHKFKAMIEEGDYSGDIFFIHHNHKEVDIQDIGREVSEFIKKAGLVGAKMVFSSNLIDHRAPIVKVKPDTGSVKLHYTSFTHQMDTKLNVRVFMNREVITSNVTIPSYTGHTLKVFSLDELVNAQKPWLYVFKTRAKREIFDKVETPPSTMVKSILTSDGHRNLSLAAHNAFLDDVMYTESSLNQVPVKREFPVLVLNQGQVSWLESKGVKLVGIRQHLCDKMKKKLASHNFIKEIQDEIVMEKLTVIPSLYNKMDRKTRESVVTTPSDKLFNKLIKEFDSFSKIKNDKKESYMLMTLYNTFVDTYATPNYERSRVLDKQLTTQYPILRMVSINNIDFDDVKHLLNYIELNDK
jgi:hypothetical protein